MKLLIIVGKIWPQPGNNTNLMMKLLPYLEPHAEIRILSTATEAAPSPEASVCFGKPVFHIREKENSVVRRYAYRAIASVMDQNGVADTYTVQLLRAEMKRIHKEFPFDSILACVEPFSAACALALWSGKARKTVYFMDPTVYQNSTLKYREKMLPRILSSSDLVLTTPFIQAAMRKAEPQAAGNQIAQVGFPMICRNMPARTAAPQGKVRLLYCGWLYSDIRSPKYFLDIVFRLDERFEVTFMGRECELLQERFPIKTKATLITLPNQPYDVALQAMADADVLINIGNSVPVHMPSKTLEYINTGKPMVNFYKFADCPTLYYTKRYPLALNLFEEEKDTDAAAARFVRFCEETIGKTVDHDWIETEFADCTPQYIAQKILDSLEN